MISVVTVEATRSLDDGELPLQSERSHDEVDSKRRRPQFDPPGRCFTQSRAVLHLHSKLAVIEYDVGLSHGSPVNQWLGRLKTPTIVCATGVSSVAKVGG